MSVPDGFWTFHLHRWSVWRECVVTTTVKRTGSDGMPVEYVDHMERRRYRVCEICGAEQEGR